MALVQFSSSYVARFGILRPQFFVKTHENYISQITCLGASRSSMFSSPFLSITAKPRNTHSHIGPRFIVRANNTDLYSVLGVSENATKSEIKTAYRNLALSYHPDVNKDSGAEENFKEINNAYEILSDDEKRSRYDRNAGVKGAGMGGFEDYNQPFDLFKGPGDGRGSRRNRIKDEYYTLILNFKEAVFGIEKEIEISRACGACNGTGTKPGTIPTRCKKCDGQGKVVESTETPKGVFEQVMMTCSQCNGYGEVSKRCPSCSGYGWLKKKKKWITVEVPAGVDSGSLVRIREEGIKGGSRGDLFAVIEVIPDPVYKRKDTNILYTCKISYLDAILGTVLEVPTIYGNAEMKVPAGTQPGTTLVMAKKGVQVLNKKKKMRGDMLVRVQIEIPKKLSKEEKRLVEELADMIKNT